MGRRVILTIVLSLAHLAWVNAQGEEQRVKSLADRLLEIGKSLQRPETISSQPEKHLDNLRIVKALREELDSVAKKYASELKSKTNQPPYSQLYNSWNYADRELKEYDRYAKMYASGDAIQQLLTSIPAQAKRGVENKAPAYFKPENDIHRNLNKAEWMLKAFEAYEPGSPRIAELKTELASVRKQVNQMAMELKGDILKGNELPPDAYRQADRKALIQLLEEKWAKEGNGRKVLKVGIVTSEWTRGIAWQRVGSEWHKSDLSKIQGYVIVEESDSIASRHSINLVKDHLAENRVSASFLNDPKGEVELINQILRTKLK